MGFTETRTRAVPCRPVLPIAFETSQASGAAAARTCVRVWMIGRSEDTMMRFNGALDRAARNSANRRRASVLAAVLWLGAGQFQGIDGLSRDAEGKEDSTSTTTLRLCITVDANLPRGAQAALMREASAIWRRSGVILEWAPGVAEGPGRARPVRVTLRVRVRRGRCHNPRCGTAIVAER